MRRFHRCFACFQCTHHLLSSVSPSLAGPVYILTIIRKEGGRREGTSCKRYEVEQAYFSSVGWARMPYFTPLFFLPPEALNAAARTVLRPCGFPFFFRPKTPLGLCFPTSLRTELLPLLALWPSKIAPDFSPPSHFDFCSFFFPLLIDGTALRFSRFRS